MENENISTYVNEKFPPLKFNKINIPVKTQVPVPNPENYVAEAIKYQNLQYQYLTQRTDTGSETFTSPTSGITYDVSDPKWQDYPDIYNRGEEGLMNMLAHLYGGKDGFILMAEDFNLLSKYIDSILDGGITVNNSLHLGGHDVNYFATSEQIQQIIAGTITVGNADKLDGFDSSYFATQQQIKDIISGAIIAGNADKLDGHHADYFATSTGLSDANSKINKIINGTTIVGHASLADRATNSENLGGHPANYYQPVGTAVQTFSGAGAPSSSLGKNGDIYVQTS